MGRLLSTLLASLLLVPLGPVRADTPATKPVAKALFKTLAVQITSTRGYNRTVTVHGDGRYEYNLAERKQPGAKYLADYRLKPPHLRQLEKLLAATGWLTRPGARRTPIMDGTTYTLTLERAGRRLNVACCGKQPKLYEDLIRFLRRINRQEWLLYQATAAAGRELAAARGLSGELDAMAGRPVVKPYAPVLDFHRLVPAYAAVLADPADRHSDILLAAARLMGLLKIESQRANLDALARKRDVKEPLVRAGAVRALVRLGAKESLATLLAISSEPECPVLTAVADGLVEIDDPKVIPALVKIASRERAGGWALIRLGDKAVPAIVEILHRPHNPRTPDPASYAIIREYFEHWKDVPKPLPAAVVSGISRSVELHGGGGTGSLVVLYGLRVLERAGKPYRPDSGRQVVARLLADLCSRETTASEIWIDLFSLDDKTDEQLVREAVWGKLKIADVHCSNPDGWAVLESVDGKNGGRVFVLTLHFTGGIAWRVSSVSSHGPDRLKRTVARLRKRHPGAKPIAPAAIEASIRPPPEPDKAASAAKLAHLLAVIEGMRTDIRRHPNLKTVPTATSPLPTGSPKRRSPTPEEVGQLWGDLASKDPRKLRRAVSALLDADERALGELAGHVRPTPAPIRQAAIRKLVADLSSPKYAVRTRAHDSLAKLGILAEPTLREILKENPSPEARRRIESLLKPRKDPLLGRRIAMAMTVLDLAGTKGARKASAELDYPGWRGLGEVAAAGVAPPGDLGAVRKAGDKGDLLRAAYEAKYRGGRHPVTPEFTKIVKAYQEGIERGADTEIEAYFRMRLSGFYRYTGRHDQAARQHRMVAVLFSGTAREAEAYVGMGLWLLQGNHNPAEAIPWFEKARAAAGRTPMVPPANRAEQLNRDHHLERARTCAESGIARCRAELASRAQADKTPWPDGVEGVQVRLRPDTKRPGRMLVDIQNAGPRVLWRPLSWIDEIQVDGQWYTRPKGSHRRSEWFGPGRQQYGIRLVLNKFWRSRTGGKPLALPAGKHTIRVAIAAAPATPANSKGVRTVSNAVDIQTP